VVVVVVVVVVVCECVSVNVALAMCSSGWIRCESLVAHATRVEFNGCYGARVCARVCVKCFARLCSLHIAGVRGSSARGG
jgi:hypothetical protein